MQGNERVLVACAGATAALAARRVVAEGGEATVVASVGEARGITGTFDRGMFAFDLPDGSGVVLAAELMLDSRIGEIAFFDPADEALAGDEHPSGLRSTSGAVDSGQTARNVA